MVQKSLAMSDFEPVANGRGHVSLRALSGVIERVAKRKIRGDRRSEGTARSMRPWCVDPRRVKFEEMVSVEQQVDDFGGR